MQETVESAEPRKATVLNLKYGEDLMEAIDLSEALKTQILEYQAQNADYEVSILPTEYYKN